MRIHEAGSHYPSSGVDNLGVAIEKSFDLAACADGFHFAGADQHGSVRNDRELPHLRSHAGSVRTREGDQLRTANQCAEWPVF